ncbi:zinc finger protein zfp-1-like isoform X1 [Dreissena polymorpha]|uniref:zinc finger protein zfp-1-like isoform X1 n=1 Tax=Dreissena polymorpha TaxID=45954 RepID=UPI002264EED9|nr:zinc finger protein zfp-1-like isoform X1 [Dreissena polymorpha]
MKEMVGGCCVCSDERGWAENPLVYCDGNGCSVAVHQACYGIIQVPTGPWFCRKCESQERAARVRCELCPLKDGALKRTDNGGWCHVVCALFIPEAWFANVQTMERIMLKNVPPDRFNRMCYICEENGKELSKASSGACMQCNKNGCKQNFHVTCAQAQGLLCEESGSYGNNVKYCGYCNHHYKKLKKDANIKTIPAFKPIPSDQATPESTPEKASNEPRVNISAEHKNRESSAARQLSGAVTTDGRTSVRSSGEKKGSVLLNTGRDSDSKYGLDSAPSSVNPPSTTSMSQSSSSSSLATMSAATSEATKSATETVTVLTSTSDRGKLFSPLPEWQANIPVTTQSSFPTSLDGISSMVFSHASTPTTDSDPLQAGKPKRSRTGSIEKERKAVLRNKTTKQRTLRKTSVSTNEEGEGVSPPVSKRSRKKSGAAQATATTVAVTATATVTTAASSSTTLGPQNFNVFGGEPRFLNPISRPPVTHSETALRCSNLPSMETGPSSLADFKERFSNGPMMGPSLPFFPSRFQTSQAPIKKDESETPSSMEELLERQWEQGSHFLMEQGQHFDIASLLSCLYKLRTENRRLEEHCRNLVSRRDHLLAVNARLTLPLSLTQPASTGTVQMTLPKEESTLKRMETSTMSTEEGSSPINVVDTSGSGNACGNSPVPASNELLRHQLFYSTPMSQISKDDKIHSSAQQSNTPSKDKT